MNLPFAHGIPPASALLRQTPEDFEVEEELGYAPDGDGEHLWLWVEKRGLNTEDVARRLAALAKVKAADVGYAGLKDRRAVTRQWFSLPRRDGGAEPEAWRGEGWRALQAVPGRRKLRRGGLSGNRFVITLREVRGERGEVETRLRAIAARGVPNYFGEQRFGRDNLARAEAMAGGALHVRDRHLRGLYLSSLRSALFNAVLAKRVCDGTWDAALAGEALNLDGSRSFFVAEALDDTIAHRLAAWDVHPTGPLWGRGEPPSRGEALAVERTVVSGCPTVWGDACAQAGMAQERRPLRLAVRDLRWSWGADTELRLEFSLSAGAYATVVIRELAGTETTS